MAWEKPEDALASMQGQLNTTNAALGQMKAELKEASSGRREAEDSNRSLVQQVQDLDRKLAIDTLQTMTEERVKALEKCADTLVTDFKGALNVTTNNNNAVAKLIEDDNKRRKWKDVISIVVPVAFGTIILAQQIWIFYMFLRLVK